MKFISFIFAVFLAFTFASCFKDEGLDPQASADWLENKTWRIPKYTVTPPNGPTWVCEGYAGYLLDFKALANELTLRTGVTTRTGSWVVYEGVSGNMLQIIVPEVIKDVYQLSGQWIIVEQTMTTLTLRQTINGSVLTMYLQQF